MFSSFFFYFFIIDIFIIAWNLQSLCGLCAGHPFLNLVPALFTFPIRKEIVSFSLFIFPDYLLTDYISFLVMLAVSELEWSQLLFISDWQRELVRVLTSLVCLLIHNLLGLCTNYPALPTKLCVTCPVMWHVTVTWHDLWCDPVTHYVTWCDRVSHAINRKVK